MILFYWEKLEISCMQMTSLNMEITIHVTHLVLSMLLHLSCLMLNQAMAIAGPVGTMVTCLGTSCATPRNLKVVSSSPGKVDSAQAAWSSKMSTT